MKTISLISLLLLTAVTFSGAIPHKNGSLPGSNKPYDEFSYLYDRYEKSYSDKVVRTSLDWLAELLRADTRHDAWLLSYGGKHSCVGEAMQRADAVKRYLVRKGIEPRRIFTVDAGFKQEWEVEFWIVFQGAPGPNPQPTVDRADVQFKIRNKNERNRCKNLIRSL